MFRYKGVRSTVRPRDIVVNKSNVWVHENISKIEESKDLNISSTASCTDVILTDTKLNDSFVEYEYDMIRYDKDEFLAVLLREIREIKHSFEKSFREQREVISDLRSKLEEKKEEEISKCIEC